MKTFLTLAGTAVLAFAVAGVAPTLLSSCASKDNSNNKNVAVSAAKDGNSAASLVNYRFIDGDSVSSRYKLAKDFQEQYLRTVSKMQQAEQAKGAELQRLNQQIEQKMRNNQYLKQEDYEADMMRLNKMQQDAQTYMANLQRNAEEELMRQQQELNDSIESFIKAFNKEKGYDAIFFKAAGVFFSPDLDITDEVVEGLNARYDSKKNAEK